MKKKTVLSMVWSVVRVAWRTMATFVIFVVLARVLSPGDFGTFALASLFVEIGRVTAVAGLGDAVTRQLDLDEAFADTAFWATLALSTAVAALVIAFAPYYGSLVRDAAVVDVLRWLALFLPVSSLGAIHNARLAREFGHQSLAAQSIVIGILSGGTAIGAAFLGWGVWSLVVQNAVAAVVGACLAWITYRWLPRPRFDVQRLRSVVLFSFSMVAAQLMWMLLARVQDIFISRWYGPVEVGRYRIAWRLIELIGQAVLVPIGSVALVTLSRLQNDPQALRNAYNRFIGAAALGTFPLLAGFGSLSDEIVPLLFGRQWGNAGDIATVLVFMAVPFVMNVFGPPALTAVDKAQTILSVAALQLSATLLLTWLFVPGGVLAVAAAYVVRAWATMPYQQYVLNRHAGIGPKGAFGAMALPLAGSLVMAAAIWLAKPVIASAVEQQWLLVAACVLLGAVVYAAFLLLFGRQMMKPYMAIAQSIRAPAS